MARNVQTSPKQPARPCVLEASPDGKIVPFRLSVLPRHRSYLQGWLEAGARMGLCDADVGQGSVAEVFVWVRENADPAYVIRADGLRWVVVDHLRGRGLGSFVAFEDALSCIRPVVPADHLAA